MKEKLLKGIIEDLMKMPMEEGEEKPKSASVEIMSLGKPEKDEMPSMESEEKSDAMKCPKCGAEIEC